jgi:hypothetical protein
MRSSHSSEEEFENWWTWRRFAKENKISRIYSSHDRIKKSMFTSIKFRNFCKTWSKRSYRERNLVDTSNSSEIRSVKRLLRWRADLDVINRRRAVSMIWSNIWNWMIENKRLYKKRRKSIFNKRSRRRSRSQRVYDDLLSERRLKAISLKKFLNCLFLSSTIRRLILSTKKLTCLKAFSFRRYLSSIWTTYWNSFIRRSSNVFRS